MQNTIRGTLIIAKLYVKQIIWHVCVVFYKVAVYHYTQCVKGQICWIVYTQLNQHCVAENMFTCQLLHLVNKLIMLKNVCGPSTI